MSAASLVDRAKAFLSDATHDELLMLEGWIRARVSAAYRGRSGRKPRAPRIAHLAVGETGVVHHTVCSVDKYTARRFLDVPDAQWKTQTLTPAPDGRPRIRVTRIR